MSQIIVDKNNLNSYKLKLTAISPIHIGTGESYEPTNFVIDNGYLYEFDAFKFFQNLSKEEQNSFASIASSQAKDSLFQIHAFIKNHKKAAIDAAIFKVQVTKGIERDYFNKIGRVVQNEGKGGNTQKIFNKFQIERTLRSPNAKRVYIPGSSIKGSISTALQEVAYKQNPRKWEDEYHPRNPTLAIMKNISISDAKPVKTFAIVGYSLNKERFEDDEQGPKNKVETIYTGSIFEVDISFKELEPKATFTIENLINACNSHYFENFKSMFRQKDDGKDQYICDYFADSFYDKYIDFKPGKNQFLLRVGKHSGARAVTIEGMRDIRVKESGGGPRRKRNAWHNLPYETTTWLFGGKESDTKTLLPFGWLLCEIIE